MWLVVSQSIIANNPFRCFPIMPIQMLCVMGGIPTHSCCDGDFVYGCGKFCIQTQA